MIQNKIEWNLEEQINYQLQNEKRFSDIKLLSAHHDIVFLYLKMIRTKGFYCDLKVLH